MNRLRNNSISPIQFCDMLRSGLDTLPDGELLERFARYTDHAAFEALMRRYGPMVYGVCRRMLMDADAEDAFQAVFLVLIRKANSLRRGRLGPWLYGVACRVAMKARSRTARLAQHCVEAIDMFPDLTSPSETPDWLPILDAELAALPTKYREALVLCELQGLSRTEAAKKLRLREGTLSSRLARGRDLLRKRLLKHGTLLPAGGLAALFAISEVGRATVPLAILTRTSELAKVAVGTAAGVVPVGAAQLRDEVLKGMFLTKLRAAVGVTLTAALLVVGVTASALPADTPQTSTADKGLTKSVRQPSAPIVNPTTQAQGKRSDRETLQGLWTLDKVDVMSEAQEKAATAEQTKQEAKEMIGNMQFLVTGDIWWYLDRRKTTSTLVPVIATIDSTKNPKWLDLRPSKSGPKDLMRCIYEISGDRLKICQATGSDMRVAEFGSFDDAPIVVMELRRGKLPPAGENALVGSWEGADRERMAQGDGKPFPLPAPRVEILGGYLFATDASGNWVGGKYTVDTTKNPKWIDVELVAPYQNPKEASVPKLYGCYEVTDGRLKLVLGTSGKRAFRPLEFQSSDSTLYFDLKPATKPLTEWLSETKRVVPTPKPNPTPNNSPAPTPASAPSPMKLPPKENQIQSMMKTGNFEGAEKLLRGRLPQQKGLAVAEDQLLLGICVLEMARDAEKKPPEMSKLGEILALFEKSACTASESNSERAIWVRNQAELRILQVLNLMNKSDKLITSAQAVYERHQEAVEGLIALSLLYHAFKKNDDNERAVETRTKMETLFTKLKSKSGAFPEKFGEYSRSYWEDVWFQGEKRTP